MWFMAGIGAIGAGLFLALRELLPWWEATRTGVVRTRSARAEAVRRDEDPERFKDLTGRRMKAAGTGLLFIVGGLAWLGWNAIGFMLAVAP